MPEHLKEHAPEVTTTYLPTASIIGRYLGTSFAARVSSELLALSGALFWRLPLRYLEDKYQEVLTYLRYLCASRQHVRFISS